MDVSLTPDQEAQLNEWAATTGRGVNDLVQEAVDRLLACRRRFKEQVQVGLAQIERGEFIEEEEMDARVARILNP